ncbi:MAG TPA: hypothetical protein VGZ90_14130 [Puia sp.]|jgi:hypothetical protein|nr:hypothetical protein [Puia sp.]
MKTIIIQYHHQLLKMVITLVLIVIVFTISSGIFADTNYYKALFIDYLKNSGYLRNESTVLNEQTDN